MGRTSICFLILPRVTAIWLPFDEQKQSVAGWLQEAIDGTPKDYGVNLAEKEYPKTE